MRDVSRPLGLTAATRGVFELALEGMLWSRRSLLMAVLLGLPIAFGLLQRVMAATHQPVRVSGASLFGDVVVLYYLSTALPLAALFYATALVADEVEGKTITYLFTRPIPRGAILAGKFGAYLATTLSLTLPSALVAFFLLLSAGGGAALSAWAPELLQDLGVLALALAAYGALFTLLGVLLRRPTIPGLMFIFVWEAIASRLPGYVPRFTLAAYLRSLAPHRPAESGIGGLFLQALPAGESLLTLVAVTGLCLAAAAWIFSLREYVLEQ